MTQLYGLGLGVGTQNKKGEWLEVFFPQPTLNPEATLAQTLATAVGYEGGNQAITLDADKLNAIEAAATEQGFSELAALAAQFKTSSRPLVAVLLAEDAAPTSVAEGYFKLQLLSHRLVKPHNTNLTGVFGVLPNVAWTNVGAIDLEELPARQLEARLNGETISVDCVDKFPKMTNYVVPKGVRIAHTARVRLGAYVGEGTTVMHEGFINFNAGTLGTSMVEGRISAGVVVGNGSDLGGGCSTMGTLSGGGNIIISVGEECLLGANAGIGIPLGDRCTVESGLYITAGTKVAVLDDKNQLVETVKARDLAGKSDLLFRRNSVNGAVECKTNKTAIALNEELHANN
ncbi:2,3,4,5-tetrahydropyridine-2,6-dicarboxylate N-succinyltransferase [Saccharophagus degradans]|uniref:2,3,4,5-tetrahydropyridine-2,6-dicarboxylate N-succinyltransferase n=1 Tax=Saccharophagus degradans TaxID=86304 RepID=A0AAW7XAF0_9GAMM|nr:2,3,4,5-tetrahydropyridine-2,6-dicarboxylate N-succinyltransferase [Saccharophagus degradans]MBU2987637.1 2,3,4,5-tetrahydropyridine-2,6-dicarboxylate N-succinyltransferase [Saccharophagus degradans]MDO6424638.1 2,3,4,5-tetrahydropyridine-2,6-dicarboxylate N-succinyltransferase [Saccharophagus degradans]MDO6608971.1 2,3,4,5-tetrahydropyridine-2,6-dicarboxylate N-succinyltransferase [Saccharophagus degradans]WGO99929.1 2,3,4,5-tetrahydropyridine-2,6-dicarboxylate N-succinyltransferase [Saccha